MQDGISLDDCLLIHQPAIGKSQLGARNGDAAVSRKIRKIDIIHQGKLSAAGADRKRHEVRCRQDF